MIQKVLANRGKHRGGATENLHTLEAGITVALCSALVSCVSECLPRESNNVDRTDSFLETDSSLPIVKS